MIRTVVQAKHRMAPRLWALGLGLSAGSATLVLRQGCASPGQ